MGSNTMVVTSTKQKVVAGVVAVAIVAAALGVVSAIGMSRGYGFGWPFYKTRTISKSAVIPKTTTPLKKVTPPNVKKDTQIKVPSTVQPK